MSLDALGGSADDAALAPPRERLAPEAGLRAVGALALERMPNEIAGWQAQLPPRAGHGIAQALRQVLDAAVLWEHIARNPAKLAARNPKPPAAAGAA